MATRRCWLVRDVWAAFEPIRNVVLFGEALGETGPARDAPGSDVYMKQYGIRFSPSDAFTLEGGKVRQIVGTFSSRQLSFRNPLIGTPDGYATTYPIGARIDGSAGMIDYRAGVLSLPLFRPGYVPIPSDAVRPAIGAGITPVVGMRFGMSATMGPYLNDAFTTGQLRAQEWKSYKQNVVAADLQVSRGYFEGHAELAHSSYDVPGRPTPIKGLLFYLEPKYTFTPRFFMAGRYERNDYPFISPVSPTFWVANRVILRTSRSAAASVRQRRPCSSSAYVPTTGLRTPTRTRRTTTVTQWRCSGRRCSISWSWSRDVSSARDALKRLHRDPSMTHRPCV